jgi:hypothetical protein
MADIKELCEASLWLSQCTADMKAKLKLSSLEVTKILNEELSRELNQAIFEVT